MIRKYKIFCLAQLCKKHSENELYRSSLQSMNLSECSCTHCGKIGFFKKHAKYKRYLIEDSKEGRKETVIEVIRFKCTECNTTHAYIPSFIIPFSVYSLRFVLKVLLYYFQNRCTIEQICNKFNISMSVLYKWIDLFKKCQNKWLNELKEAFFMCGKNSDSTLRDFEKSVSSNEFLKYVWYDKVFLGNYQHLFGLSFMEHITSLQLLEFFES